VNANKNTGLLSAKSDISKITPLLFWRLWFISSKCLFLLL